MKNQTKKLVFGLCIACVLASVFGVLSYFQRFHRAKSNLAPRPQLVVYTHTSFMGPYGPGLPLAKSFEKLCLCDIRYVDGGGGKALLERLRLAESVDVVLGLDQVGLKYAAKNFKWRDLKPQKRDWLPVFEENHYKTFLPYDWSPVSLISRSSEKLEAQSLTELLQKIPDQSLSLQDPRYSSLGLQLVYWAYLEADKDLDKLRDLAQLVRRKTKNLGKDWSASYGQFKKGISQYVLSYSTSPLYHQWQENDPNFVANMVANGLPTQIEYAAVPDKCLSCGLAERFVEFLTSTEAQRILLEKNFMLPVVKGIAPEKLDASKFETPRLDTRPLDDFVDQQDVILELWLTETG